MAQLVDWADDGVISTYFSCLAAHAAVLHRDGIARQPLARKLSGVFAARGSGDDPLLAGMPAQIARAPFPAQRCGGRGDWWRRAIASCRAWAMAASICSPARGAEPADFRPGPSRI